MFKKIRRAILKVRETYYRGMYIYCESRKLRHARDEEYKASIEWKDRANEYLEKQTWVTKRLWNVGHK